MGKKTQGWLLLGQMYGRTNVWKQKGAGGEGSSGSIIHPRSCRSAPGAPGGPCCHCTRALPRISHRTDPVLPIPAPPNPFPDRSVPPISLPARTRFWSPPWGPRAGAAGPEPPEPSLLQLEGNSHTWRAEGELSVLCVHLDTFKTWEFYCGTVLNPAVLQNLPPGLCPGLQERP